MEARLAIPVGDGQVSGTIASARWTRRRSTSSRTARASGWLTRAWNRMRKDSRSAGSRRCAINFRTWRSAVGRPGPADGSPMRPCARRRRSGAACGRLAAVCGRPFSYGGRMTSQAQAHCADCRRARSGVPRLSASPGRSAGDRSRRSSRRSSTISDAVRIGRCAMPGGHEPSETAGRRISASARRCTRSRQATIS